MAGKIVEGAEKLMGMTDAVWERHANPWSVYTRFTCLPLLVLAIWSRVWLGWGSLAPIALALFWIWANPRAFPPPKKKEGWAYHGVRGERLYLARKERPIPKRYERAAALHIAASSLGALMLVYGLWVLSVPATLVGLVATVAPKVWFVNGMVGLSRAGSQAH